MPSKLHELLAVEGNLEQQAEKCTGELKTTFEKKRHLFEEKLVTFSPSSEGAQPVTEEQSDIQTTVAGEVKWLTEILVKAIDASHAIDVANQAAKADVVLEDGTKLLAEVPSQSLLALESRLKSVRDFCLAIPTLDPAKGFKPDPDKPKGIYRAREVRKSRTKKEQRPLVLYGATDKFPAQTQLITEDVVVGTISSSEWSGLTTPATKASILERCDMLLRAVKRARSRANEMQIETEEAKVGKKLLEYLFAPIQEKAA